MSLDFLSLLEGFNHPLSQEDHFKASHLEALFTSKIARSQATGKDGIRVPWFQKILADESALIERKIAQSAYEFTTYKERLILRGADREPRQISIPTVRDRLTLRAVCEVLHSHAKASIGATPHSLVDQVVNAIRTSDQTQSSFVRLDVRNFFPSISHKILQRELAHFGICEVVRSLCMLAVATPTGAAANLNSRGVPQGLSVSGALSAIYMLRFDAIQRKKYEHYFRYVDDILLICKSSDADDNLKALGRSLSSTRGLTIHKKGVAGKTEISPVSDGIDFLGYHICPEKVSIRQTSFRRMFKNILKVITDYRYRRDLDRLIFRINLKISGCIVDSRRRGWMMFFSRTEDMSQLAHLDAFVKQQIARVDVPEKSRSQVKRFVKSYHEIRFNLNETTYIPNFDNFTKDDKINAVVALSNYDAEQVANWSDEFIEQEFSRRISKEVHDLEQDVGNPS